VAAVVTLLHGAHAFDWRGYSDKELAARFRANDLLQRLAIEDACRTGCRYYSMGESGGVASLIEFMSRFGARPQQFPQYDFARVPLAAVERWPGALERADTSLVVRRAGSGS
jgi:hypothetical protein